MAPTMVPCRLCGLAFTSGSLKFHEKACARRQEEQAQRQQEQEQEQEQQRQASEDTDTATTGALQSPIASAIRSRSVGPGDAASSRASSTDWGVDDDGMLADGVEVGLAPLFDHTVCENEFDAVLYPSDQPRPTGGSAADDDESVLGRLGLDDNEHPLSPSLSPPPYVNHEREECDDQPHPPPYQPPQSPASFPNFSTLAANATSHADASRLSAMEPPGGAAGDRPPPAKCVLVDGELAPILPAVWAVQHAHEASAADAAADAAGWVPPTPHPSSATSQRGSSRSVPRGTAVSVSPSPARLALSLSASPERQGRHAAAPSHSTHVGSSQSTSPQRSRTPPARAPAGRMPSAARQGGEQQQRLERRRVELRRNASRSKTPPTSSRAASAPRAKSPRITRRSPSPACPTRSTSPSAGGRPASASRAGHPTAPTRRKVPSAARAVPAPDASAPPPPQAALSMRGAAFHSTPVRRRAGDADGDSFLASPQPNKPLVHRPVSAGPTRVQHVPPPHAATPDTLWNTPNALLRFDTPEAAPLPSRRGPEGARGASEASAQSTQPPSPGSRQRTPERQQPCTGGRVHGAQRAPSQDSARHSASDGRWAAPRGALQPRTVNTTHRTVAGGAAAREKRDKRVPAPPLAAQQRSASAADSQADVWNTPVGGDAELSTGTVVKRPARDDDDFGEPQNLRELQLLERHRAEVAQLIASQEARLAHEQAVFRAELDAFAAGGGGAPDAVLEQRLHASEDRVAQLTRDVEALRQTCRNLEQERGSLRSTKKAYAAELAQCKEELAALKQCERPVSAEEWERAKADLATARDEAGKMRRELSRERTRGERLQALLKSRGQQQQQSVEKLAQQCERRERQLREDEQRLQDKLEDYTRSRTHHDKVLAELEEKTARLDEMMMDVRQQEAAAADRSAAFAAQQRLLEERERALDARATRLDAQDRELAEAAEQQMVEKQRLARERSRVDAALHRREKALDHTAAAADPPHARSSSGSRSSQIPAVAPPAPVTPTASARTHTWGASSFLERDAPSGTGSTATTPRQAARSGGGYDHKHLSPTPTKHEAAGGSGWELRDAQPALAGARGGGGQGAPHRPAASGPGQGSVVVASQGGAARHPPSRPGSTEPNGRATPDGWELHDAAGAMLGGARRRDVLAPHASHAPNTVTSATQQAHQARGVRVPIPTSGPPSHAHTAQLTHPSLSYHMQGQAQAPHVQAPAAQQHTAGDDGVFLTAPRAAGPRDTGLSLQDLGGVPVGAREQGVPVASVSLAPAQAHHHVARGHYQH